ncbi:hypothetical protein AAC387_Pa07g3384 [Persea americana]
MKSLSSPQIPNASVLFDLTVEGSGRYRERQRDSNNRSSSKSCRLPDSTPLMLRVAMEIIASSSSSSLLHITNNSDIKDPSFFNGPDLALPKAKSTSWKASLTRIPAERASDRDSRALALKRSPTNAGNYASSFLLFLSLLQSIGFPLRRLCTSAFRNCELRTVKSFFLLWPRSMILASFRIPSLRCRFVCRNASFC